MDEHSWNWRKQIYQAEDLEEVRTREQHNQLEVEIVCLEVKDNPEVEKISAAEALYRRWLNVV